MMLPEVTAMRAAGLRQDGPGLTIVNKVAQKHRAVVSQFINQCRLNLCHMAVSLPSCGANASAQPTL